MSNKISFAFSSLGNSMPLLWSNWICSSIVVAVFISLSFNEKGTPQGVSLKFLIIVQGIQLVHSGTFRIAKLGIFPR